MSHCHVFAQVSMLEEAATQAGAVNPLTVHKLLEKVEVDVVGDCPDDMLLALTCPGFAKPLEDALSYVKGLLEGL